VRAEPGSYGPGEPPNRASNRRVYGRRVIRVVLLDLGGTLVEGNATLPGVPEALTSLRQFVAADGTPVQLALVSDFTMATPPLTKAKVDPLVQQYLALLDGFGLRRFFKPVDRHVTLSTQAGVNKPDRRVYELALSRLATGAGLVDCVSITEDPTHVAACRALGMTALQFGNDFTDWTDAPLLLRRVIDPASAVDAAAALTPWFAARGLKVVSVRSASADKATVTVRKARAAAVEIVVRFAQSGRVVVDEHDAFLHSLAASGQLGPEGHALEPGVTHTTSVDDDGNETVTRRRYSAL
jgi:FMN phosphatase YigB (HAD superfamily)